MSPDFLQIWNDSDWYIYKHWYNPSRSRNYYKIRSIVRLAIWLPITWFTIAGVLAVFS